MDEDFAFDKIITFFYRKIMDFLNYVDRHAFCEPKVYLNTSEGKFCFGYSLIFPS